MDGIKRPRRVILLQLASTDMQTADKRTNGKNAIFDSSYTDLAPVSIVFRHTTCINTMVR